MKKKTILLLLGICLLAACSYDSAKAVKNGDVINMHGPIFNFDRFDRFLESLDAGKAASIRITNYTLEGNPTLYNLSFDGTAFELVIDRSKNKERGDNPAKESRICSELVTTEGEQLFMYTLEGCQQGSSVDSITLISIMKEQLVDHEH